MNETKEKILNAALGLFAANGYEAVSVSDIAGALNMTKGALYRHFTNKRDIFNHILARMEELDGQRAQEYQLPTGTLADMEEAYRKVSVKQMAEFGLSQFRYWTEEIFPSNFRKMLTLEQYRSEEMQRLYQQYLAAGPLGYITDIFRAMGVENADRKAIGFYAPMFLFYSVYDGAEDKGAAALAFEEYSDRFFSDNFPERHMAD